MEENCQYEPVCALSVEPNYMFELAEKMKVSDTYEVQIFSPSSSKNITYPSRNVQVGSIYGNTDLDDSINYESLRNTL